LGFAPIYGSENPFSFMELQGVQELTIQAQPGEQHAWRPAGKPPDDHTGMLVGAPAARRPGTRTRSVIHSGGSRTR
ncbi:hypothetical protein, partial [Streptomyces endophyticus]